MFGFSFFIGLYKAHKQNKINNVIAMGAIISKSKDRNLSLLFSNFELIISKNKSK
jgi:hypothetical protein